MANYYEQCDCLEYCDHAPCAVCRKIRPWDLQGSDWADWLWRSGQSDRIEAIQALCKLLGEPMPDVMSEDEEFSTLQKLRERLKAAHGHHG